MGNFIRNRIELSRISSRDIKGLPNTFFHACVQLPAPSLPLPFLRTLFSFFIVFAFESANTQLELCYIFSSTDISSSSCHTPTFPSRNSQAPPQ